jgi:hypothetical protein
MCSSWSIDKLVSPSGSIIGVNLVALYSLDMHHRGEWSGVEITLNSPLRTLERAEVHFHEAGLKFEVLEVVRFYILLLWYLVYAVL